MATIVKIEIPTAGTRCKAPEKRRVWQRITPSRPPSSGLMLLQGTRKKKGMATVQTDMNMTCIYKQLQGTRKKKGMATK